MVLGQYRRAIGVFSREQDLDYALNELRDSGFPMDKVSVVAKDTSKSDSSRGENLDKSPGNIAGKGAAIGSVTGTTLGILAGLFASAAAIALPGIGTILAAGTVGSAIATTLAGGGVGAVAGGLVGTFAGLGIPGDRAKVYSDRLSQGDYLLIIEGRSDEITRAEMLLLNNRGIEEWGIYDLHSDTHATAQ